MEEGITLYPEELNINCEYVGARGQIEMNAQLFNNIIMEVFRLHRRIGFRDAKIEIAYCLIDKLCIGLVSSLKRVVSIKKQ